jgi:serine/threonine protein kinase
MPSLFSPGDLVSLNGQNGDEQIKADHFHVVRRLGSGSYAVVYLVRELLAHTPLKYGRNFAIKCLNIDQAQQSEVTIHHSLKPHPNIVTLHRTLRNDNSLLLLLEYVPGEDLFYFLEQARDHCDIDSPPSPSSSNTPPTPSLLSALHPAHLLSQNRLRLIASMFAQMCDAVAACHAQHVFHRDIKPENFIVTDGWQTNPDGSRNRRVIVKLTDFGLATTDLHSSDMDCGSAPYMSYGSSFFSLSLLTFSLSCRMQKQRRTYLLSPRSRRLVTRYRPHQHALPS